MKHTRCLVFTLMLAGSLLVAAAWAKSGQHTQTGKAASLTFDHPTQVGSVLLPPGDYTVRFRANGTDHFMEFQRTKAGYHPPARYDVGKPVHVPCQIEPLAKKVSKTEATFTPEGNTDRLAKIDIAGEVVEHLF